MAKSLASPCGDERADGGTHMGSRLSLQCHTHVVTEHTDTDTHSIKKVSRARNATLDGIDTAHCPLESHHAVCRFKTQTIRHPLGPLFASLPFCHQATFEGVTLP